MINGKTVSPVLEVFFLSKKKKKTNRGPSRVGETLEQWQKPLQNRFLFHDF